MIILIIIIAILAVIFLPNIYINILQKQMHDTIRVLQALSSEDRTEVIEAVSSCRFSMLQTLRVDLKYPVAACKVYPNLGAEILKQIKFINPNSDLGSNLIIAMHVWFHTIRAGNFQKLILDAEHMWHCLYRDTLLSQEEKASLWPHYTNIG